jgi:antitoxin component of MazEF toxin-antitoxin module
LKTALAITTLQHCDNEKSWISMRTAVRKLGNSAGVLISRSLLAELGLGPGEAVDLSVEDGRLILAAIPRGTLIAHLTFRAPGHPRSMVGVGF